ncbi:hypothetical protein D3C71_1020320 [compost metagenome]
MQLRRDVGVGDILHAGCDAKFALFGVVERQVVQIPLDAELHVARAARHHGVPHIVARLLGDGQRQVAVHTGPVRPVQGACEVQHPRKARAVCHLARIAGMPSGPGLALGVGIGKLHIGGLHGDAVAIELPAHIGAEPVQRQHRVFEHAGQHQRAGGNGQRCLAARLGHVDVHRGTPQAQLGGRAGGSVACQRQSANAPAYLILLQVFERAFPGGLDLVHEPVG